MFYFPCWCVTARTFVANTYFRELCLELLGKDMSCVFQAFHSVHGKGGIWQGDRALADPTVIHGAGEIRKWL